MKASLLSIYKVIQTYLSGKTSENFKKKKEAIERFQNISNKPVSEQVKIFAKLFEEPELLETLMKDYDRNFWWHVLAVLTVIPAIILAVESYFFSSKKTPNFFKGHSEIFCEQIFDLARSFHVMQALVEKNETSSSSYLWGKSDPLPILTPGEDSSPSSVSSDSGGGSYYKSSLSRSLS